MYKAVKHCTDKASGTKLQSKKILNRFIHCVFNPHSSIKPLNVLGYNILCI